MVYSTDFMKHYDVLVIGAGSAGLGVGIAMKRFGFSVLMVEKNDHRIGGDCLNDGCVPSKALIHVSRQVHHARNCFQVWRESNR